jgi:hypothetical protein
MCVLELKKNVLPRLYLRGCRAVGLIVYMREDIIKMEFEDVACATVVWTEIKLMKT